jgi:hypothetical protein
MGLGQTCSVYCLRISSYLVEFIQVKGGVKSMKHLKGGASYRNLGTSDLGAVSNRFEDPHSFLSSQYLSCFPWN